jgi:hypothetical protein
MLMQLFWMPGCVMALKAGVFIRTTKADATPVTFGKQLEID